MNTQELIAEAQATAARMAEAGHKHEADILTLVTQFAANAEFRNAVQDEVFARSKDLVHD